MSATIRVNIRSIVSLGDVYTYALGQRVIHMILLLVDPNRVLLPESFCHSLRHSYEYGKSYFYKKIKFFK